MINKPIEISTAEWKEIMGIPYVREGWGLEDDCTPEMFREMVYGVKFDYITDGPGYGGDLYLIQNGALDVPIQIIRKDGVMRITGQADYYPVDYYGAQQPQAMSQK